MHTRTNNLMPGFFNDVMNLGFDKFFKDDAAHNAAWGHAPVNITDTPEAYQLSLVAPGLEKADFQLKLDQNVLTISYEKKAVAPAENEKVVRREFVQKGFKRSFTINDKIDAAKIGAQYVNGILQVVLPKKDEVKVTPQEITVA